jgi:ribonuclease D
VTIHHYRNDLPDGLDLGPIVAIDTETMGLDPRRDRLCVVQLSSGPVWCTKIASRLVRTYTDRHGLRYLAQELLDIDLSKQQQSSDWGTPDLSEAQRAYAASDVLHLHRLKEIWRLGSPGRVGSRSPQACFDFLPMRAEA